MSKNTNVTVTVKPAADVKVAAKIDRLAKSLGATYADRKGVHVKRAEIILDMRNLGLSYAGIEKAVIVALGYRPQGFSASTAQRYGLVIDATTREDVAAMLGTGDAREAVVNALYRLAGPTPKRGAYAGTRPADRVREVVELIIRGKGSADAVNAATAAVDAFNAGEVADATATPQRAVGGEAADGGKVAGKVADTADVDAAPAAPTADSKSATGTLTLIQALADRLAEPGQARGVLADPATQSALARVLSTLAFADADGFADLLAAVAEDATVEELRTA